MTLALRYFILGLVAATIVHLIWQPNLWIVLAAFVAGQLSGLIVLMFDCVRVAGGADGLFAQ